MNEMSEKMSQINGIEMVDSFEGLKNIVDLYETGHDIVLVLYYIDKLSGNEKSKEAEKIKSLLQDKDSNVEFLILFIDKDKMPDIENKKRLMRFLGGTPMDCILDKCPDLNSDCLCPSQSDYMLVGRDEYDKDYGKNNG